MRDSGVEWIAQIPNDWQMVPNYAVLQEVKHIVGDRADEYTLLSLTKQGVIVRDLDAGGKFPSSFDTYKIVVPGQMVFCLFDIDETPRTVGLACNHGMITGAYDVFDVDNSVCDRRYLLYYYLIVDDGKHLRPYYASLRKTVTPTAFRHVKMPLPPLGEQQFIADYLDERCAAIDGVRQTITDEIEALRRLRKSTIHRAVTKGLDEGAPIRDSGMFWATVIHSDWRCCRVKDVVHIGHGSDPKLEGNVPVWGSGEQPFRTCGEKKLGPTVLLGRKGTLNNPQYVEGLYWNVDTAFDAKPSNRRMILRFFFYVASSIDVEILSTNTAKPSMTQSDWGNISIPLPPLSEQQRIADYLDERCTTIESVIETRIKQLERLDDYRRALIFAYVTGKKEVPSHE